MHLRDREITIAEILKKEGYRTGHFGKWHLSTLLSDQPSPAEQGFDHSLGTENNASPSHLNPVNFVRNGVPVPKTKGYSCQIVVDETIGWLDEIKAGESGSAPFFACVWYHEPHSPIASPSELVEKYQAKDPKISKRDATYYANIENVDRATGRLLDRIKKLGIDQSTMVFITSDNGGVNGFSNQGLRGKKSHLWEGGHRVPGIFRWPGKIEAGTECMVPVCGVDLLPTICEFTGGKIPTDRKLDGTSLASLLTGTSKTLKRETPLYWFFYRLNPSLALRDGRWGLIADTSDAQRLKTHSLIREDMAFIKSSRPEKFLLFDLTAELPQQKDLSKEHPEVFERLKAAAVKKHADVVGEGPDWEIPKKNAGKARIWNSH
jgi:arylsulfatase A